ncbi:IS1634 family transposase [Cetobacterium sp.]|uniref:IS1634 family transposase n=1 Tax=Cetobacterium sp. TaxID=2071632 RepID=UPI002FCBBD71
MQLQVKKSGRFTYLYVIKSFRTHEGKSTTKVVEKLGTIEDLAEKLNGEDPIEWAKRRVGELTIIEKEEKKKIRIEFSPFQSLKNDDQRCYNGGYLFLQKVYHELGLDKICDRISKKYKNEYDLNEILSKLLYTRVLYPGSKQSSLEDSRRFLEQPKMELHQIYRALSLLSKEMDMVQASVYKNSLKLGKRKNQVIYYDCTNYFFESEEESGLRQYGVSKEHRPNPIVQMGMFMDMDGVPLAFNINPGNTNEQVTLKPLEKTLQEKFGISKVVVCTDAGLSSNDNRINNSNSDRSFITVQSLKKIKKHLQDWSLDTTGWSIAGSNESYDISQLNPNDYKDVLFFKERWTNENNLEQRLIVTFSFKYQNYLRSVRNKQIERAENLIDRGDAKINKKRSNDFKRFIEKTECTKDGEVAELSSYTLNKEMIEQEERFDGFYAICTDLEDSALEIIKVNSGRWIIENGFRIMKTDFDARPVFLHRDDRIKAHFLTCFLSLLLYKYLEKKINRGRDYFTPNQVIKTLVDMNFVNINGEGYIPTYTRTNLTNALHGTAGFRTDTQIVTKQKMKSIISDSKKQKNIEK